MPFYDLKCEWCGHEQYDKMEPCNTSVASRMCPACHMGPVQRAWLTKPSGVIGDEIDIWIRHGLVNDDGSPRHFRSKQEIFRVAREKGLVNSNEHIGTKGGDKSKFTTRWDTLSPVKEEDRLRRWHEHEDELHRAK